MNNTFTASPFSEFSLLDECEMQMRQHVCSHAVALNYLERNGPRTYAKICIDIGVNLHLSPRRTVSLAVCAELLHNAALLQTKGLNGSQLTGCDTTASDAMVNAAYGSFATVTDTTLIPLLLKETQLSLSDALAGQTQLQSGALTMQTYENSIAKRTGALLRLAMALPIIAAGHLQIMNRVYRAAKSFAIADNMLSDAKHWQPDVADPINIIDILSQHNSTTDALFTAKNRAHYLLKMCLKDTALLPNHCASVLTFMAQQMVSELAADSASH